MNKSFIPFGFIFILFVVLSKGGDGGAEG